MNKPIRPGPVAQVAAILDGRTARREGSRRRLLIAGLRLIERGNYRPSPKQVTEQAGMHERSFHSIFGDHESYLNQLIEVHEISIRESINKDVKERGVPLVKLMLMGKR